MNTNRLIEDCTRRLVNNWVREPSEKMIEIIEDGVKKGTY